MLLSLLMMLGQVPTAGQPSKMDLKVGQVTLIKKVNRVNCTNRAVVEAALVDGRYEVKGLAAGTSQCTFSGPGSTQVVDFTVGE